MLEIERELLYKFSYIDDINYHSNNGRVYNIVSKILDRHTKHYNTDGFMLILSKYKNCIKKISSRPWFISVLNYIAYNIILYIDEEYTNKNIEYSNLIIELFKELKLDRQLYTIFCIIKCLNSTYNENINNEKLERISKILFGNELEKF